MCVSSCVGRVVETGRGLVVHAKCTAQLHAICRVECEMSNEWAWQLVGAENDLFAILKSHYTINIY